MIQHPNKKSLLLKPTETYTVIVLLYFSVYIKTSYIYDERALAASVT